MYWIQYIHSTSAKRLSQLALLCDWLYRGRKIQQIISFLRTYKTNILGYVLGQKRKGWFLTNRLFTWVHSENKTHEVTRETRRERRLLWRLRACALRLALRTEKPILFIICCTVHSLAFGGGKWKWEMCFHSLALVSVRIWPPFCSLYG